MQIISLWRKDPDINLLMPSGEQLLLPNQAVGKDTVYAVPFSAQ